jgi:hypothetical protein
LESRHRDGGLERVSAGWIQWVWMPNNVGMHDSAMASRWLGCWLDLQRQWVDGGRWLPSYHAGEGGEGEQQQGRKGRADGRRDARGSAMAVGWVGRR